MSPGMKQFLLGVLAAVALTGCPDPGEGEGGNDPAALVGSWSQVADPGEDAELITFGADGTYELDGPEGAEAGTYTANASVLVLTDDNGQRDEMPYVVEGDQMLGIGLSCLGSCDGFIGEWHADGLEDGDSVSIGITVRADNTATLEAPSDSGPLEIAGTWRLEGAALVTTMSFGGQTVDIVWHSLRDRIGAPLYERD
jgi:hypothetical protein